MIVYVLRGIPGSGKSTYAKQLIADHADTFIVNRDSLRQMLQGGSANVMSKQMESAVLQIEIQTVQQILSKGNSVIIDDLNLGQKNLNRWQALANQYGAEYKVINFNVPLDVALERNANRDRVVPANVIRDLYIQFSESLK